MEVKFDASGKILGAANTSYLLEKSRCGWGRVCVSSLVVDG